MRNLNKPGRLVFVVDSPLVCQYSWLKYLIICESQFQWYGVNWETIYKIATCATILFRIQYSEILVFCELSKSSLYPIEGWIACSSACSQHLEFHLKIESPLEHTKYLIFIAYLLCSVRLHQFSTSWKYEEILKGSAIFLDLHIHHLDVDYTYQICSSSWIMLLIQNRCTCY